MFKYIFYYQFLIYISISSQDNIIDDLQIIKKEQDLIAEEIIDDSNKILFFIMIVMISGLLGYFKFYFRSLLMIPEFDIKEQKKFCVKYEEEITKDIKTLEVIEDFLNEKKQILTKMPKILEDIKEILKKEKPLYLDQKKEKIRFSFNKYTQQQKQKKEQKQQKKEMEEIKNKDKLSENELKKLLEYEKVIDLQKNIERQKEILKEKMIEKQKEKRQILNQIENVEENKKQSEIYINLFDKFTKDYDYIKKKIINNLTLIRLRIDSISCEDLKKMTNIYTGLLEKLLRYSQNLYFIKIEMININTCIDNMKEDKKNDLIVFDSKIYQKSFHWIYYLNDSYIQNILVKKIKENKEQENKEKEKKNNYKNISIIGEQILKKEEILLYLKEKEKNLKELQENLNQEFFSKGKETRIFLNNLEKYNLKGYKK
jgi:hypothetical protein